MIEMKSIPWFPGYQITKDGRVWSEPRCGSGCPSLGRWLKPQLKKQGYYKVTLGKIGKRYSLYIHRLVLETFVGPCPDGMECRHLDGNPRNNNLNNLRWGTRSENGKDTVKHGRCHPPHYMGINNPATKLNPTKVRMIIYMYRTGLFLQREIAKIYNVSTLTISNVVTKKTWGHLWY